MKKIILVLSFSAFVIGATVTSCNTPAQKVEDAKEDLTDAKKDLNKANEEYLVEIEEYRKQTAEKIEENNQSIAEFRARKELDKKEARDDYNKKIADLEEKNTDMKRKMDDYKMDGKENWEKFKTEFSRDMDELGKAFKDLTVKNVK